MRELAAFVRKRDKRMAAWQAELARQQQEREAQEKARCGRLIVESSPRRHCLAHCDAATGSYLLLAATCGAQTWQAPPCHKLPCLPAIARGLSYYTLRCPDHLCPSSTPHNLYTDLYIHLASIQGLTQRAVCSEGFYRLAGSCCSR